MVFKVRGAAAIAGVVSLLSLGGCGTLSSITGGSSEAPPPSAPRSSVTGSSWRDAFIFGASSPPPIVKPEDNRTITCPSVAVIDGTAAYRVAQTQLGNEGVNYQASVAQVARECRLLGNTLDMRVGIDGRLLLGPAGKPGTFAIPVRVAIKRGDNVVYSKVTRESVTIAPGETQAPFTHIEEGISLTLGQQDPGEEYDVLVGFDPEGAPKDKPKAKARRRH